MGKYEKGASFQVQDRRNLRIYCWYSLPNSKYDQKCVISYFFIEHSRNEAFRDFIVNFIKRLPLLLSNDDCYKNVNYIFPISITVSPPSSSREKSYQYSKYSNFLFLTTYLKASSHGLIKVHSLAFGRVLLNTGLQRPYSGTCGILKETL